MYTAGVIVVVMTSMVNLTDSPAFVSIQPLKFLVFFFFHLAIQSFAYSLAVNPLSLS